ncbi:MAG: NDP-sugar synthase [Chloroflexota bacterium]
MKAVILAGGKATRLLPLTSRIPKAMVPVLNTPFIEHVIGHLSRHGIKDIVLAQGHLARSLEEYLGDGRRLGVRLSYATEDTPLGTAGAAKNAARYVDGPCLVLNGDIFTDLDFTAMVDFHRRNKARVTIALTPVADPTQYGLIETTAAGRVTRFLEKPKPDEVTTNMINAGTYVLEPDVLAQIKPGVPVSFEREVFPGLLSQGQPVYAFSSTAYWIDIGTPEKYLQLHRDLLSNKASQSIEKATVNDNSIHPTAQIQGPVVIGKNCSLGPRVKLIGPVVLGNGCSVAEDSMIEGCVVWHNVRFGPRVQLKDSVVADNCCFMGNNAGENVVLGDNVTVARGVKLESGSRIEPETTIE